MTLPSTTTQRLLRLELLLLDTRAKLSRLQNPDFDGYTPEEIQAQDFEAKYNTLWYDDVINSFTQE
tara:strand:- start:5760 stop:5957 length:198 start_codon:yes stop_codon:yes gene_type:complete